MLVVEVDTRPSYVSLEVDFQVFLCVPVYHKTLPIANFRLKIWSATACRRFVTGSLAVAVAVRESRCNKATAGRRTPKVVCFCNVL
jgi:hypothetical protein